MNVEVDVGVHLVAAERGNVDALRRHGPLYGSANSVHDPLMYWSAFAVSNGTLRTFYLQSLVCRSPSA